MKRALTLLALLLISLCAFGQNPGRLAHTFSIVARDAHTGEIGVAVHSHYFSVGQIVPWAAPGVGAVATQSFVEPSYGPLGLAMMRAGKPAPEALKGLLEADPAADVRQVAMIDAAGHVAAWTGAKDIQSAGHIVGQPANPPKGGTSFTSNNRGRGDVGEGFSVEANLMANDTIWPAMAKAFRETNGDLADRLLAALDAAQSAGGDIRGRQSAALLIVSGQPTDHPWDRLFDVRVDDATEPLKELRRLVTLQRAYNHENAGDLAVEHHDNEAALREYAAAEKIAADTPGVPPSRLAELSYWHAAALVNMGKVDESLPLFRRAFAIEPGWRTLTPRLPRSGLLPDDAKLIERICAQ